MDIQKVIQVVADVFGAKKQTRDFSSLLGQVDMHTTLKQLLDKADWDWKLGKLLDAQAGYREALEIDPKCWAALVQLIWFNAAFGQVKAEDLLRLEAMRLPEHADRLPEHLRSCLKKQLEREDWGDSGFVLDGELEDLDIGQLKLSAKKSLQQSDAP